MKPRPPSIEEETRDNSEVYPSTGDKKESSTPVTRYTCTQLRQNAGKFVPSYLLAKYESSDA